MFGHVSQLTQMAPELLALLMAVLDPKHTFVYCKKNVVPLEKKRPLIHDRFPVHRCKAVLEWISNNKAIYELPLPPKSPDLMPLEGIWREILDEIRAEEITVSNPEDLWKEISKFFQSVCTSELVSHYVDKMPHIVMQIREKQGDALQM